VNVGCIIITNSLGTSLGRGALISNILKNRNELNKTNAKKRKEKEKIQYILSDYYIFRITIALALLNKKFKVL
jgi:hypothetical protein